MARLNPRWLFVYLAILVAVAYGALLIQHIGYGVGAADSSGYANTARLILSGRIVAPIEALDRLELPDRFARVFIPLAFEPGPRPRAMVPLYPPGFPVHVAAAALVAGWNAGPFIVSPILAIFCLLLTFLLGREIGLSRPLAFAGAAILGGCGVFLFQAVQPMSDVAASCWAVAAVLLALRSRRNGAWAAAAGAAFGIAVLIRPTNLLLALPLALALPWRRKALALFLLGGAPFAAFGMVWNRAAYGSFFGTGYSGLFDRELALSNFAPRLRHYGRWLIAQLSVLIPLAGLAVVGDRRVPGRDRAMLVVWFVAFFLFYCFWGPYDAWWYTRYLLPALPALILGALLVFRDLIRLLPERAEGARRTSLRALAVVLLLLVVAVTEWRFARRWRPLDVARGHSVFPEACRWLAGKAGERGLVVSMEFSGALRFYTELTPVRWDQITPEDFAQLRAKARGKDYRIFRLVFPFELDQAGARAPGRWTWLGKIGNASVWELEPGG